jgi:cation transport protein ChaC
MRITRESLLDGTMLERLRRHAEMFPDMIYRSEEEVAALLEKTLAQHDPTQDVHVFAYGSLIWNPAFHYVDRMPGYLHGWHRRFCLRLMAGRGTPEKPGLMLALDRGGACKGVVYRIAADQAREELSILWRREMFGGSYNARWVKVETAEGENRAVTFVCNRDNPRYIPELSDAESARLIATGCGDLGTCREYLENTVEHLATLGMRDSRLSRILKALPKA